MEKELGTFRKTAFGGFNRRDVIDYIEKMKNETFEYKMQVEETVRSLNDKINELENVARQLQKGDFNRDFSMNAGSLDSFSLGDIKTSTKHLKAVADELCRSLGSFIERLTQNGLCDAESAPSDSFFSVTEETEDTVGEILSFFHNIIPNKSKAVKEKKEIGSVDEILDCLFFMN